MIPAPLRVARFASRWTMGVGAVEERELRLRGPEGELPASLHLPRRRAGPVPGWIVLHGITRPGRRHPELVRFARALAASRAAVLIPEIPAWTELRLEPGRTEPAVEAAADALEEMAEVAPGPPVLVGFSFGAPQAIRAAAGPGLRGRLAGVVGFGGYCDLERTVRFQFTGVHGWRGETHRLRPDPYGRWIVGANYLTGVAAHAGAGDVARALHRLAAVAGEHRVEAWHPRYDGLKSQLREGIAPGRRDLFDLFAPPSAREPDPGRARELVPALVEAARSDTPLLDPAPFAQAPPCPVHLVHGRDDRLVPFTETWRLQGALPPDATVRASVTALFGHSRGSGVGRGWAEALRETWRFARALGGVLDLP